MKTWWSEYSKKLTKEDAARRQTVVDLAKSSDDESVVFEGEDELSNLKCTPLQRNGLHRGKALDKCKYSAALKEATLEYNLLREKKQNRPWEKQNTTLAIICNEKNLKFRLTNAKKNYPPHSLSLRSKRDG